LLATLLTPSSFASPCPSSFNSRLPSRPYPDLSLILVFPSITYSWLIACACPSTSRLHETCRFLLDHPRRCYTYLFPAHQTVFLSLVIVIMTLTDWVSFLVLDIGTPVIEAIPVGTRISAAFLQSAAVRAAGFSIVPLASLAPAVKVLYIIMMYISVYPVRSLPFVLFI
jgi:Trk-type K+ transport system membrane component